MVLIRVGDSTGFSPNPSGPVVSLLVILSPSSLCFSQIKVEFKWQKYMPYYLCCISVLEVVLMRIICKIIYISIYLYIKEKGGGGTTQSLC